MRPGAHTPEQLESLLEDAFLMRDVEALCAMFAAGAVLLADAGRREARGSAEIGRFARTLWNVDRTYVAEPCRVIQARGTALVVGRGGISVVRRRPDGEWRYAIALLASTHHPTEEQR